MPSSTRFSWLAFVGLVAGGAIAGFGPQWAPAAWLGVAVLAWALAASRRLAPTIAGLWLGGLLGLVVGHPWQADFVGFYLPVKTPAVVWAATLATGLAMAALTKGPIALAWAIAHRRRVPVAVYLPLAWACGEAVQHVVTSVSYADWLYTQWQFTPVLRTVGWLGWWPTLGIGLFASACLGQAIARRELRWGLGSLAAAGVLALAPALAPAPAGAFDGLGAVHIADRSGVPRRAPDGTSLLVWPETSWPVPLAVAEGDGAGAHVRPPIGRGRTAHLLGAFTSTPGGVANALVAMNADGLVTGCRTKRLLFPFSERAIAGLQVPGIPAFRPGRAPLVLSAAGRRVGTLICLEAQDRDLALEAARAGAEVLVLSSSDAAMGRSPDAARQMLAVAALRAVETHLPVVRASRGGPAAFVGPDGRILAETAPGTDGVLTLAGDAPPTGRAPSAGATVDVAVVYDARSPELGVDLPAERCAHFRGDRLAAEGAPVRAHTVVLAGHSEPPEYLGLAPARLARAVAGFHPDLVVLDTCYGASTPMLSALAEAGVTAVVVAPPFRIPLEGLRYGDGFLAEPDAARRARLVETRPPFPLFRRRLAAPDLKAAEAAVAAMDRKALRRGLVRLKPPLVRSAIAPDAPLLVAMDASRFKVHRR